MKPYFSAPSRADVPPACPGLLTAWVMGPLVLLLVFVCHRAPDPMVRDTSPMTTMLSRARHRARPHTGLWRRHRPGQVEVPLAPPTSGSSFPGSTFHGMCGDCFKIPSLGSWANVLFNESSAAVPALCVGPDAPRWRMCFLFPGSRLGVWPQEMELVYTSSEN